MGHFLLILSFIQCPFKMPTCVVADAGGYPPLVTRGWKGGQQNGMTDRMGCKIAKGIFMLWCNVEQWVKGSIQLKSTVFCLRSSVSVLHCKFLIVNYLIYLRKPMFKAHWGRTSFWGTCPECQDLEKCLNAFIRTSVFFKLQIFSFSLPNHFIFIIFLLLTCRLFHSDLPRAMPRDTSPLPSKLDLPKWVLLQRMR